MSTNEITIPNSDWEAQISHVVHRTTLEEIKVWINEGKLQPNHKVRMKNLTWIEAQKVPAFQKLFEAIANSAKAAPAPAENSSSSFVIPPISYNPSPTAGVGSSLSKSPSRPLNQNNSSNEPAEASLPFKLYEQKALAKAKQADGDSGPIKNVPVSPEAPPKKAVIEKAIFAPEKKKAPPKKVMTALIQILGFLAGCVLVFGLSWGGSQVWVYDMSGPSKVDDKSITELLVLDEKLVSDKVGLRLKYTNGEAELAQEITSLEKEHQTQRKVVIDSYRKKLKLNDFNKTFYASFSILLILFVVARILFGKSKEQNVDDIPARSAERKMKDILGSDETEITDSPGAESAVDDNVSTTNPPNQDTTSAPNIHTTNSPGTVVSLNDFLLSPDYLRLVEQEKSKKCLVHKEQSASFFCELCTNNFCSECPKPVGGVENCCPFCKVLCKPVGSISVGELTINTTATDKDTERLRRAKLKTNTKFTIYDFSETKTQKVSVLSAFCIALFLSGPIAYFWVYKISPRFLKTDTEVAQNVPSDGQKPGASTETKPPEAAPNANTAPAKVAPVATPTDEPCIDPQTQTPFQCDEETRRALDDHTKKTKSVADAQKQVKEKTNLILGSILPKEDDEQASAPVVEEDPNSPEAIKRESDKRRFFQIFAASFVLIFGSLLSTRLFGKEQNK